ncbi:probable light-harvesting complex-like protein OHP1, chloroplastic [Coccomyxa sp. Obi]|nr:probable light-harvesting complex-like protein OHP1, chloroplastic [Coccomyxa sp. Obi]
MAHTSCNFAAGPVALENRSCGNRAAFSNRNTQIFPRRSTPSRQQRLTVRAEGNFTVPKPPKRVTQPPVQPEVPQAKFGFVESAEILNSRAAMLGFFGILLVEALAGKGIFEMVGISVGNGLGFEF